MSKSRFVWHDLNTPDAQGAMRFYGELFGWTFEASGNSPYQHIKAGERMIGGIRKTGLDEHAPPHWLAYVGVDDVAATVAAVKEHGGRVYMPTTVMPDVGTFAVVADPSGAVFAPWKSARPGEDVEPAGPPGAYTFCWDELLAPDPAASARFYAEVFGWGVERMEMPGMTYTLLKRPGEKDETGVDKNAGGVMQMPPDARHPPFWLPYVAVPDADATAGKAGRLGGTVVAGPMDIPNVGRFAVLLDAQQASIAILAAAP
jgi:predicted enzyme related to lactoylglutathione lyase